MKKAFLATCLAGCAGIACAQSSVTLYGRIDNGIQYQSGPHGNTISAESGDFGQSYLALKGSEDIGGGTHVTFHLESGLNTQNGTYGESGLFGRAATVGIDNDKFGKFIMGNLGVYPIMINSYDLDPNFMSSYSLSTLVKGRNWAAAGSGMEYTSPNMGGLVLWGEYDLANSTNWNGNGGYGSGPGQLGGAQGRSDAVMVTYNGSIFELMAMYDEKRDPYGQFSNVFVTSRSILTGGTVTLGPVKVYVAYQHLSAPNASDQGYFGTATPTTLPGGASLPTTVDHEWIGAAWQVTPFVDLNAAVYHVNVNNGNGNANLYTIAGQYNLSKRTFLYAEVAYVHNSSTSNMGLGDGFSNPYGANSNNDPINGGANTAPNYGYGQFGTFAGIMHQF